MPGQELKETAPGFGVAGLVLCPILKSACVKHACEFWVELTYGAGTDDARKVGRCALAWNAILQAEGNQATNRLTSTIQAALGPAPTPAAL
jgi:hypothetical protein